ncbi:hypothetical protein L209DRAFT_172807 [Thermothelomyces heterothallicus CBS 203.75]
MCVSLHQFRNVDPGDSQPMDTAASIALVLLVVSLTVQGLEHPQSCDFHPRPPCQFHSIAADTANYQESLPSHNYGFGACLFHPGGYAQGMGRTFTCRILVSWDE